MIGKLNICMYMKVKVYNSRNCNECHSCRKHAAWTNYYNKIKLIKND